MKDFDSIFQRHDTDTAGKLNTDQIQKMLAEIEGHEPSEEELEFIMKSANFTSDSCISRYEMDNAVRAWRIYLKKKPQLEAKIKEFDKSGTGKLEKTELRLYLSSLNGGKSVTDEEAEYVLAEADFQGDGAISPIELTKATAVWYAYLGPEKKLHPGCCSLM
mmetsp:Transcript_64479/g.114621  ORF Transcript_64479/g.114621 Transcript_64479/m.114621 type:complete len:162 (+) Transcript_64479:2-487(+)